MSEEKSLEQHKKEQREYQEEMTKRLEQGAALTKKIKHCIDIGTLSFYLDDGRLVALGHFAGGDDTIGHDEFSMIDWQTFIDET